jgi:hypothetical protein
MKLEYSPLRYLYWFAAVALSVCGLAAGAMEFNQHRVQDSCSDRYSLFTVSHYFRRLKSFLLVCCSYWVQRYISFRFWLGVGQPPVHLFALMPARLKSTVADWLTSRVFGRGELPAGIERFYTLIKICNICLVMVIPWGAFSLAALVACNDDLAGSAQEEYLRPYIRLEIVSLFIVGAVLAARIVAGITNQTRNWFFLHWSHLDVLKLRGATPTVAYTEVEQHL